MDTYPITEEARKLHYSSFVADLHADTLLSDRLFSYDMLRKHKQWLPLSPLFNHVDVPRMKEGGISLQAFSIVTNYWIFKKSSAEIKTQRMHQIIEKSSDLEWALSGTEAEEVWKKGKIGAFLGMEGVHPLEGKIENLEWFHQNGLRYASLTHFNSTHAAYSSLWPWNRKARITLFGRELISAMNELGVIVDLAHVSYQGILEAAECSRKPVIVSHGFLASKRKHKRGLDEAQLKAIAKTGGVIGVIFWPWALSGKLSDSAERIIDHIDGIKETIGIGHAALGSDFDGWIHLPDDIRDVRDMPLLTQLMLNRGYSHEEIKKVLGLNFLRVYKEVCG